MKPLEPSRGDWIAAAQAIEPTVALMLGMGLSTTSDRLNRDIDKFLNAIQRRAYGPRWPNRPAADRPAAIGFHEHLDSNHHVHLAVRASPEIMAVLAERGNRTWKAMRLAGDFHFAPIDSIESYTRYITKEIGLQTRMEIAYMYAPKDRDW